METWLIVVLCIVGVLVLGLIISCPILNYALFVKFFGYKSYKHLQKVQLSDDHYSPFKKDILEARERLEKSNFEELTLTSFDGLTLYAKYFNANSDKTAILVHGYNALALNNFSVLTENLLKNNFNVLLVDQRGHNKSYAKQFTYGIKEKYDLLNWIDFIDDKYNPKNIIIYGISMGATTVGMASSLIKNGKVKCLFYDCGFTSIYNLMKHITEKIKVPSVFLHPSATYFASKRQKVNIRKEEVTEYLSKNKIPTMFIYGEKDDCVPIEFIYDAYKSCSSEKELLFVNNAGHATSSVAGGQLFYDKFYAFIDKYTKD